MSDASLALARAFAGAYPNEAARTLELATAEATREVYSEVGSALSAGMISDMAPVTAARTLSEVPAQKVASILTCLPPQRGAQLLRSMEKNRAAAIISEMSTDRRAQITQLMTYDENQVGSRMDPRAPAARLAMSAEHTLELVKKSADGALNYVYVLDAQGCLKGVASMRVLMSASPEAPISSFMTERPDRAIATDSLTSLLSHPGWIKTHALPVVDQGNLFLGVIRYSTYQELKKEAGLDLSSEENPNATAQALVEIFGLGTTALGGLVGGLLLGFDSSDKGSSR